MSKLKISVWANYEEDEKDDELSLVELPYLRPRNYMLSWSFKRLLKYISEELYWQGIPEDNVKVIVISNKDDQWENAITREKENDL